MTSYLSSRIHFIRNNALNSAHTQWEEITHGCESQEGGIIRCYLEAAYLTTILKSKIFKFKFKSELLGVSSHINNPPVPLQ